MSVDRSTVRAAIVGEDTKHALETIMDQIDAAVAIGGVGITATAAEVNILHSSTATTLELSSLHDEPASVTTTATPATGTCGVQFVFKNAAGVTLSHAIAGRALFTGSTGLAFAAATSAAVLTNGAWHDSVAGYSADFVTTAAGLLGVTVTAGTGSYYITFILPNGKLLTSSVLGVN